MFNQEFVNTTAKLNASFNDDSNLESMDVNFETALMDDRSASSDDSQTKKPATQRSAASIKESERRDAIEKNGSSTNGATCARRGTSGDVNDAPSSASENRSETSKNRSKVIKTATMSRGPATVNNSDKRSVVTDSHRRTGKNSAAAKRSLAATKRTPQASRKRRRDDSLVRQFFSTEAEEDNRAFVSDVDDFIDDDDVVGDAGIDRRRGDGDSDEANSSGDDDIGAIATTNRTVSKGQERERYERDDKRDKRKRSSARDRLANERFDVDGIANVDTNGTDGFFERSLDNEGFARRVAVANDHGTIRAISHSSSLSASTEVPSLQSPLKDNTKPLFGDNMRDVMLRNFTSMDNSLAESALRGNTDQSILECPNLTAGSDSTAYHLLANLSVKKCLDELYVMTDAQRSEVTTLVTEISRTLWRIGKFSRVYNLEGGVSSVDVAELAKAYSFDDATDGVLTQAANEDVVPNDRRYTLFSLFGTLDQYVQRLLIVASLRRGCKYDFALKNSRFVTLNRAYDHDHMQYLQRAVTSTSYDDKSCEYKLNGFFLLSVVQRHTVVGGTPLKYPVFVDHGDRLAEVLASFIREKYGLSSDNANQFRVFVNLSRLQKSQTLNVLNSTDVVRGVDDSITSGVPSASTAVALVMKQQQQQQFYGMLAAAANGAGGVAGNNMMMNGAMNNGGVGNNGNDDALALVDLSRMKYIEARNYFVVKGYILLMLSSSGKSFV